MHNNGFFYDPAIDYVHEKKKKIYIFSWTFEKDAAWEPVDIKSKFDPTWNWNEKPDENLYPR